MNHFEFKNQAKDALSGRWITAAVAALLVTVLSGNGLFVGTSTTMAFGTIKMNFSGLISMMMTGPLSLGFVLFITSFLEGNEDIGLIFSGFKRFSDTLVYHILTSLLIMLGMIFFIVPGVMLAMRYSMGYFIMRDVEDVTATEAMALSKALMEGYKMDYFKFVLSFFGWLLLSLITVGIGFLFLYPYFIASQKHYYEKLKEVNPIEM
ncbi:MAG: DUF975 family protein [Clostridia bacterium]|nr:DUF975 family protein [Clostridia bacterium]